MNAKRWKAQIVVELVSPGQTAVHVTDSVAGDGIFFRTDAPPSARSLVRMTLVLPPSDERLTVHGVVSEVLEPTVYAARGVRVGFFAQSTQAAARWHAFLKFLKERHPQATERSVVLAHEPAQGSGARRSWSVKAFDPKHVTTAGMFLPTSHPFAIGSDVRITLVHSAGEEKRVIPCTVRRRVTTAKGVAGVGLEYKTMTAGAWTDLAGFLEKRGNGALFRADVNLVWSPQTPVFMQTLPGPWSKEVPGAPASRRLAISSLPPDGDWLESAEAGGTE